MRVFLSLFTAIQSTQRISPSIRSLASMSASKSLVIDEFAHRQFVESDSSKSYGGTVFSTSIEEFEEIANSRYDESNLVDGYAPFCKHIFIENDFSSAQVNVLAITPENEHFLRSKYEARNEKELPVLTRHFPKELVVTEKNPLPVAKFLDLILYSREQVNKENEAMGKEPSDEASPWAIVSIKAQDVNYEIPMTPITAMRNALGKDEGGSGVPLDRASYLEAFQFWDKHATVS